MHVELRDLELRNLLDRVYGRVDLDLEFVLVRYMPELAAAARFEILAIGFDALLGSLEDFDSPSSGELFLPREDLDFGLFFRKGALHEDDATIFEIGDSLTVLCNTDDIYNRVGAQSWAPSMTPSLSAEINESMRCIKSFRMGNSSASSE